MILGLISIYIIFSIAIALGILRYEQELNGGEFDIVGLFIYPITWPFFIGIALSKIINSDYVLTINYPTDTDDEGKKDSDKNSETKEE